MEILGRNIGLGNGNIELQFDGKHEIHHFQGADTEVAELSVKGKRIRRGAARA